jgi:hypothetical protein
MLAHQILAKKWIDSERRTIRKLRPGELQTMPFDGKECNPGANGSRGGGSPMIYPEIRMHTAHQAGTRTFEQGGRSSTGNGPARENRDGQGDASLDCPCVRTLGRAPVPDCYSEGVRVQPAELGPLRWSRDWPLGHPEFQDADQGIAGRQPQEALDGLLLRAAEADDAAA